MKFKKNLLIFLSIHLFCFSIATQACAAEESLNGYECYDPTFFYEDISRTGYNMEENLINFSIEEKTIAGNIKHYLKWENDNIDTDNFTVEIYAVPYINYIPATKEDVGKLTTDLDKIPWKEIAMPAVKCCTTDAGDCETIINFSDIYQTYIDNIDYSDSVNEWHKGHQVANCLDVIGRFLHLGTPGEDIINQSQRLQYYLNNDEYAQYIKFSRVKYYARYVSKTQKEKGFGYPITKGTEISIIKDYSNWFKHAETIVTITNTDNYTGTGQLVITWPTDEYNKTHIGLQKLKNGILSGFDNDGTITIKVKTIKYNEDWEELKEYTYEYSIEQPLIKDYGNYIPIASGTVTIDENYIKNNARPPVGQWYNTDLLYSYSKFLENDATITKPSGGNGDFIGPTQKPAPDDEEDSEKDKEATSKHKTDEDGTKNTKDILYYVKKIYKLLKAWFIFDAIDKIWNEIKEIVKDEIDEKVKVATQTADIAASKFPFCVVAIPITVLNAIATDPVTPGADKTTIPIKFEKTKIGNIEFKGYEYKLKLDFKPFNNIAKVTRGCIYLLFLMYLGTRTMRVYNAFIKE